MTPPDQPKRLPDTPQVVAARAWARRVLDAFPGATIRIVERAPVPRKPRAHE